ncbi:MAG TPA: sugar phosphate isomerase/epimerase family protein [Candidatus Acidoferrum sp.]|nr:sugar phosphate isomerase/epimerase family protein [Candidatus Acidoferrum sp.]
MQRREFLKGSAGALALAALAPGALAADEPRPETPAPKRRIKKGIMWATVGVQGSVLEKMQAIKAAGFEGTEMMSHMDQDEVLRARDATGLVIPSVCGRDHWTLPLSSPDPNVRAQGLEALKQTLRDGKRYGASSVLLVPGIVNKDISYQDAYQRSQAEIRKAVPLAEELGVKIAIEDVWNHFLLSPLEAARYVDEFNSPAVGWHFDVGNILNYGWPEQWIAVLGPRIQKLHIKEFSLKKRDAQGPWKGFDVKLMEGDINWPAVMKALDGIHYQGWAITEQAGGDTPEGLKDLADRLSRILAS